VNVGDIHIFLKSLGSLLAAHKGKSPADDFEAFSAALEPFKDQGLDSFARFLRDADEYKRTGKVSISEGKKGRGAAGGSRKTSASKPKLKTKDDTEAIQNAVARLQTHYDRYADPTLTHAMIEAEVEQISGEFDVEGLKAVARGFDLKSGLTSKNAVKGKILNRIIERKGRYDRSEAFSAASTPVSSPPENSPPSVAEPTQPDVFVEVVPD
jgi:hypothetical protein